MIEHEAEKDCDLVKMFEDWVGKSIDENGVYPAPAMVMKECGGIEIARLDLPPLKILEWFWRKVTCEQPREVIFGQDHTTREGQGTEFADVLICAHWVDSKPEKSWSRRFRVGVINYQHEPRIVRPMDWDNEFWIKQVTWDLLSRVPRTRILVKRKEA